MTWKIHRILNKYLRLEATTIQWGEGREATHNEIHFIQAVGDNEPINITELGAYLGITKSAASQMVTKLVAKGLIEKDKSVHSGKELQLSLTQPGWQAYKVHEQYHGKNTAEIADRLSLFSLDQIATVSVVLDVVESVLDERLE
jgi:DNA-binding MarR family transcriptional regulator